MCAAIIVGFLVGVIAVALGVPLWAILTIWLLKQSAPEGAGISPVALGGSFKHFFFSPLQRFPCSFVVAIASELDRLLRSDLHFVQHRFQSKGIFVEEKRGNFCAAGIFLP